MPIYEYVCQDCGKQFSRTLSFAEHEKQPKPPCPKCNSRKKVVQRVSSFQAVTGKKT